MSGGGGCSESGIGGTIIPGGGSLACVDANLSLGDFNASVNTVIFVIDVDATNAVVLPATPTSCSQIVVTDTTGDAGMTPILVEGNGNDINGVPLTTVSGPFASRTLRFDGTEWRNE